RGAARNTGAGSCSSEPRSVASWCCQILLRKQLINSKPNSLLAGIYFHIPFCKQACQYCDFHFVTSLKYRSEMLAAMGKELHLQCNAGFLPKQVQIGSIYFGGGTPSLLAGEEIAGLIDHAATNFDLSQVREITLEANPDDLTGTKLDELRRAGINRLSIGVQSFFDEDLQWMNRAHRAREAESAIRCAQDA